MAEPDLITVKRPPVVEVALAVQFEPNTVQALRAALLRTRLKDEFPDYQEQIARPPIGEDFSPPALRPPVSFELMAAPPTQRFWFLSRDGARLIQLQHDLMAANWRRLPRGAEYPRHRVLRTVLRDCLDQLNALLLEEGEAPIKPNWCEVTYINHIGPLDEGGPRPEVHRVLRWLASPVDSPFLPGAEDVQLNERFLIEGGDTEPPRGRLNISLASAYRAEDRVPIWVLTLTARIRSADETLDGAMEALELGREWADRAFAEMTTSEMHETWGLERKEQSEFSR